MRSTIFPSTAAFANSRLDQRESGLPLCRGNVQASAVTRALWLEGKKARGAGPLALLNGPVTASLPSLSPPANSPDGAPHGLSDPDVGPFGVFPSQQKNPGSHDFAVGSFAETSHVAQLLPLLGGEQYPVRRLGTAWHRCENLDAKDRQTAGKLNSNIDEKPGQNL